jgi:putative membrane protein
VPGQMGLRIEGPWTLFYTPLGASMVTGERSHDIGRADGQEAVEMMDGYAMSGWAWLLMTLGMLGFWALVAVVAVALLRGPGQRDQQQRPGAEDLLAERLARGEIAEEYRQRLQTLQEATGRR